jgi:aspartyl-tRNA synthetase
MVEGPHFMRTHHAASIGETQIGERVTVAGWIQRRRDHGGIAFLDIRDASGIIQVVADPAVQPEVGDLRMEFCGSVSGIVRHRPEGTQNPEMTTGTVEIGVDEIVVLSAADALPFMIDDRTETDERARLRYRYLDLRRVDEAMATFRDALKRDPQNADAHSDINSYGEANAITDKTGAKY